MDDFPDRPDHDDFWKLSAAVIDNDVAVEGKDSGAFERHLSTFIDSESVWYMARQRVAKFFGAVPRQFDPQAIAQAAWIDGFTAACAAKEIPTIWDGQHRETRGHP